MIRPLTCVCVLLAGGSGLYLYQAKHQAQMLDREIARTLKDADVARDRIGVLRGEWALLNEPERLAQLSQAHLGLTTLSPTQFATVADLGIRLPPPVLPGTTTAVADEAVEPSAEAILPSPPQPVPAALVAAPAVPAPSRMNVAVARQPATVQNQPAAAFPPPPHPVTRTVEARAMDTRTADRREDPAPLRPPMQIASALPMPLTPLPAPRSGSTHPVLAPVVNVSATPIAVPPQPAPAHPTAVHPANPGSAAAPPRSAPQTPEHPSIGESVARAMHLRDTGAPAATSSYAQSSYGPASASALGGNRPALPPPVPFGSAGAASSLNAH